MKKFKVTRTYSLKTFQDFTVVEAETAELASELAEAEYFGPDIMECECDVQEEVEEVEE